VLLTLYVLHCLVTLQLTDSGSVLLYALYIAERLLLCIECDVLVYVVRQTVSYIKIQCDVLVYVVRETASYIKIQCDVLVYVVRETASYIEIQCDVLVYVVRETAPYIKIQCDVLVYVVRETAPYIKFNAQFTGLLMYLFVIFSSVLNVESLPVVKPTVAQFKTRL
jgi:hypothetical protein